MDSSGRYPRDEPHRILPGDSEMARRMRAFDWSGADLGLPQSWPQNLRIAVSLCLTSRFPIVLWWGANHTVLYNDTQRSNFVGFDATVGRYTFVVGTYDGSNLRSFTDTAAQQISSSGNPVNTVATTKIGNHAALNGDYLGSIDEVRISRIARSPDYVTAQSRSMNDTYITYGPEEPN